MAARTKVIAAVGVLLVVGIIGVSAQTQMSGGSLAEVANEIRLLRTAIETNGQTQALASLTTLQQSRIQPLTAELLATRKELDAVVITIRTERQAEANFQSTGKATLDSAVRHAHAAAIRAAETKEAILRARESDLAARLQNEEAVWQQLVAQLQEAIRR